VASFILPDALYSLCIFAAAICPDMNRPKTVSAGINGAADSAEKNIKAVTAGNIDAAVNKVPNRTISSLKLYLPKNELLQIKNL
jgi:hypothetical protein